LVALFLLHGCWCLVTSSARAQFLTPDKATGAQTSLNNLVASYAITSIPAAPRDTVPMLFASDKTTVSGHKSVFLAAVLSAILPGLGEYYVGDNIWRGLVFTGVEAGLWVGMIRWNQRFNDSLNGFYAFSDKHWSTARYGDSLNATLSAYHVSDSCNCYAMGNNIASINRAEAQLDSIFASNPFGDPYGHRLVNPSIDNQQYYEMISKYPDPYTNGWDNAANFNLAGFMRADANAQADVANIFLYGIILNHLLSAVDAALMARDHNSPVNVFGNVIQHTMPDGSTAYFPTAHLEYRF
jgi:hypothetical protein